ncbi:hypothetical protein IAR50_005341 [Cryptococcus sp. DSM 104548]
MIYTPPNATCMTEVDATDGQRQPNFLQKLYAFLALSPHPCPEIIYWASDSKQLVLAHPERLVKEVLPKLFKHDKIASFGRQLNIYGFSRLFPGRQFKDASGNVSNASVWAHPTLHRLSTPETISNVKRRAPPKLIRTRRLANGDIVRTRAGPAVLEKAKEVREVMREGRRKRVHAWPKSSSNNTALNVDEQSGENISPSASFPTTKHRLSASSHPDTPQSRLADIPEIPDEMHYHHITQTPPATETQSPTMMSHSEGGQSPADVTFFNQSLPLMSPPLTSRLYRSAPAFIQTTPAIASYTVDEWKLFLTPPLSFGLQKHIPSHKAFTPRLNVIQPNEVKFHQQPATRRDESKFRSAVSTWFKTSAANGLHI